MMLRRYERYRQVEAGKALSEDKVGGFGQLMPYFNGFLANSIRSRLDDRLSVRRLELRSRLDD
jgi:hypothetical protein